MRYKVNRIAIAFATNMYVALGLVWWLLWYPELAIDRYQEDPNATAVISNFFLSSIWVALAGLGLMMVIYYVTFQVKLARMAKPSISEDAGVLLLELIDDFTASPPNRVAAKKRLITYLDREVSAQDKARVRSAYRILSLRRFTNSNALTNGAVAAVTLAVTQRAPVDSNNRESVYERFFYEASTSCKRELKRKLTFKVFVKIGLFRRIYTILNFVLVSWIFFSLANYSHGVVDVIAAVIAYSALAYIMLSGTFFVNEIALNRAELGFWNRQLDFWLDTLFRATRLFSYFGVKLANRRFA
jgi:hypothetical protein